MIFLNFFPETATFLMFVMMGTQLPQIGKFLVLAEFALFGLLILAHSKIALDTALRWWWVVLTPLLAMVSAIWSDLPAASFRYGAQFLWTGFVGLLLARLLTPRRFVTVFMLSMLVFCVLSILNGRQGTSAEGYVLIGLTGSKNQMGYAAQLLLLSSLAVLMLRGISAPLRAAALLAVPIAAYLVWGTNSATAVLQAVAGAAALFFLWVAERLPPGARLGALIMGAIVALPFVALGPEIVDLINHFVFDTLNKDPTLTGRTVLWAYADDLIAHRPLLGYGFQAFWLGDSPESQALKAEFNVVDGRVFHFHHQFRQVAVDTGLLGLACFAGVILAALIMGLRQILIRPDVATSFFFVVFLLMVVRAFTDVIIGPFSMHTVIFYACCTYAFWRPEMARARAEPALPWHWRRPALRAR